MIKNKTVEAIVIGGGPAGYTSAIRIAQLGGKVTLVEREYLGGTCLNYGCIPTKALLEATGFLTLPVKAAQMGVELGIKGINPDNMMQFKKQVIEKLRGGIKNLLNSKAIELIEGSARFIDNNTIEIQTPDGTITRQAKKIILATGSKAVPFQVDGKPFDYVMTNKNVFEIQSIPKSILIIGAGAVGIEVAFIFRNLGAEVHMVELMPRLLPQMDDDIVNILEKAIERRGIKLYKEARIVHMDMNNGCAKARLLCKGSEQEIKVEKVFAGIGRIPDTDGLFGINLGIVDERGRINVNSHMETLCKGVYAAGDATGGILLAHVASYEGIIAAENAMGKSVTADYKAVPSCIYSTPEVASVGLSERQAREKNIDVRIGQFPYAYNGKSLTEGNKEGMAKIVADSRYGEILGVHIIGERATELIAQATLAIKMEATAEELAETICAHPTLSETVMEAAASVLGMSIHLP